LAQVYAKINRPTQYLYRLCLMLVCAGFLMLGGCTGGAGGYGSYIPWGNSNTGVVTKDPDSIPDIAWQTTGQRQTLNRESDQQQKDRPSLQTVVGAPPVDLPKTKVTLLLPLTGKNATLGQSMLKAAQMALFDVGSAGFELVPKDTKSTPDGAAAAARDALSENAKLILGPIFAEDVAAAKAVLNGAKIPMIAFTTDWKQAGNGTYIMGFLPFVQVTRVAQFAQSKGYGDVAVYAPQTEYCDIVISTLQRSGVNVARTERYAPSQADLLASVETFIGPDRENPGFNALMLPVGGENLRSVVSVLRQQGLSANKVKFLGTGLWDDDTLRNNPAVHGGWFAAPDPALRRDFEKRYQENYGGTAPRLASLAYDATAMAAVLARSIKEDPYAAGTLTNPRGFAGIDGVFRFRPDGLNERGLAILEIQGGSMRVIDPAPTAFISPGM
jgi:branched-chain amino acid transport system substrate-binding protein